MNTFAGVQMKMNKRKRLMEIDLFTRFILWAIFIVCGAKNNNSSKINCE